MSQTKFVFMVSLSLAGLANIANAQWVGTSIHPVGKDFSAVFGAGTGIAVGNSGGNLSQAGYWTNGGTAYHTLHQAQWVDSLAHAGDADTQVGDYYAVSLTSAHAARWNGTPGSFVDMNPDRFQYSTANAMFGTKMAGLGLMIGDSNNRALLWNSGDPNDYVDLSLGLHSSGVMAMTANTQVGYSNFHAAMWSGTAASMVDLNPVGSDSSFGRAAYGDRQGGSATDANTGLGHAQLWTGTAASAMDLHPVGYSSSEIESMSGNFQVGNVFDNNTLRTHAAVWSGSAGSFVDLNSFLTGFTDSEATGVVEYADHIEIYGFGYENGQGGDRRALMWTQAVPEPATFAILGLGILGFARRKRK